MVTIYRVLMGLYPAKFRAAFAAEMTLVFGEAAATQRHSGTRARLAFALREYVALIAGAAREQAAQAVARGSYISAPSMCSPEVHGLTEIAELERHVDKLVRAMEHEIAHHDFVKARQFSNEEQTARNRLNTLRAKEPAPGTC